MLASKVCELVLAHSPSTFCTGNVQALRLGVKLPSARTLVAGNGQAVPSGMDEGIALRN